VDYKQDPEAQYRAGYEEGVWDLLRALEGRLPPDAFAAIRTWKLDLDAWRVASRQEVARGRKPEKILAPPLGYPPSN
jgi:hypothetical protein